MFQKIFDIRQGHEQLTKWRYGMIVAEKGKVSFVQMRPFPKLVSVAEVLWLGAFTLTKTVRRDRVQVFYNHPRNHENFLAAKYAVFRSRHLAANNASGSQLHGRDRSLEGLRCCSLRSCKQESQRTDHQVLGLGATQSEGSRTTLHSSLLRKIPATHRLDRRIRRAFTCRATEGQFGPSAG